MSLENLKILGDTLDIIHRGGTVLKGSPLKLKLTRADMEKITLYLPDEVEKICNERSERYDSASGFYRTRVYCTREDSYTAALNLSKDRDKAYKEKPVLVLNFANPYNPGGGVRRGAKAQEEDLCRRSTLLLSLESDEAAQYYEYNKSIPSYMGTNAIMISPMVEVFKDEKGNLLKESTIVAVMTCAAPMLNYGMGGYTEDEYRRILYTRIDGMLKLAAYLGYKDLILGAFGCGAFGNDAAVVSDIFYDVLKNFEYNGFSRSKFFNNIVFAVRGQSNNGYNYNEFARNFDDFYRFERDDDTKRAFESVKANEVHLDAIKGSLFGGAVGDALGYAIEFSDEAEIFSRYGKDGITEYSLTGGKALISDDTQMSLFTANGILFGITRGKLKGIGSDIGYVDMAYLDWYKTQTRSYADMHKGKESGDRDAKVSWLLDIPELYARRAPGTTCMYALKNGRGGLGSIERPINHSKGCGGIMRVAPLAMANACYVDAGRNIDSLDRKGAEIAALTHSHSLGYMPAAVLTHIISRILSSYGEMSLIEIIREAKAAVSKLFPRDEHLPELIDIIDLAVSLSENDDTDLNNIHKIGQGWVAEETLGIALYCSLKYQNDFSKAVFAAVNHSGDSDSTGAVTGNIVGAIVGYDKIEDKWKDKLELGNIISEMAEDLCRSCQEEEGSSYKDRIWESKYLFCEYPE